MTLPAPATFAEGQRKLYGIAAGIAGVCFGLAVMLGAYFLLFGAWTPQQEATRLYILAGLLFAGCSNTTIVIIGLLLGGPVGRLKGEAALGDKKLSLDAERAE